MEILEICKHAKEAGRRLGTLDTDTKNRAILTAADLLLKETEVILAANEKDLAICKHAKEAGRRLGTLDTDTKNRAILTAADLLLKETEVILAANEKDLACGRAAGLTEGLLDRLRLDEARLCQMAEGMRKVAALDDPVGEVLSMNTRPNGLKIGKKDRLRLDEARLCQMAEGMRKVAALDDPVGEVLSMNTRPNGLKIGKKRVPLGVVGMIYEARPNVTTDAFALCLKTGNAVILKGGSDALASNQAIVVVLKQALAQEGVPADDCCCFKTGACAGGRSCGCRFFHQRHRSGDDGTIYADERVCGCFDPKRRRGTDPCGHRACDDPCD